MLRFYFLKPDAKLTEMSPATRDNWFACCHVLDRFDETELSVIRSYFTAPWRDGKLKPGLENIAAAHGMTISEAQTIIDKAIKSVAIERGLADE